MKERERAMKEDSWKEIGETNRGKTLDLLVAHLQTILNGFSRCVSVNVCVWVTVRVSMCV